MKAPNIIFYESIKSGRYADIQINIKTGELKDTWVDARPLGFNSIGSRVKAAWLVLTGKADALVWPEDKERGYV